MRAHVLLKRLLWMIPTLVVITALSYGMMRAAPGDPVRAAMLASGGGDAEARQAGESAAAREFRRRYHLDQPWTVGYWRWLVGFPEPGRGGLLHGEWDPARSFAGLGGQSGTSAAAGNDTAAAKAAPSLRRIRLDVPVAPKAFASDAAETAPAAPTASSAKPSADADADVAAPSPIAPAGGGDLDGGAGTGTGTGVGGLTRRAVELVGGAFGGLYRLVAGEPGRNRGGLVHGDFGTSIVYNRGTPVWDVLKGPMAVTIKLQLWSMAVIYLVALPFGLYSAVFRGSLADRSVSFGFFVLYSLPSYWVGLLLILAAARFFPSWPISGMRSALPAEAGYWTVLADALRHYALPVFCLSFGSFASLSRFARVSVLEIIRQDFVRTARAKGLSEWTVMTRHVLRNSLITMVTLFAGLLPGLLGGSIIIEYLFTINGMGSLMQQALASRDYPILMTDFGLGAVLVLVGVLFSDLLYTIVDPRIELG